MIYVDTNVFIALLLEDATSVAAETWWNAQVVPLAASTWVAAEFYAHVGLRQRKGELTPRQAVACIRAFDDNLSTRLTLLPGSDHAIHRACNWLRLPGCALKAPDAIHLAIAIENEVAALATFDKRFAHDAEKLRIPGLKIIALPTGGAAHKLHEDVAQYVVTERDIAKAVKSTRQRKLAERAKAIHL